MAASCQFWTIQTVLQSPKASAIHLSGCSYAAKVENVIVKLPDRQRRGPGVLTVQEYH